MGMPRFHPIDDFLVLCGPIQMVIRHEPPMNRVGGVAFRGRGWIGRHHGGRGPARRPGVPAAHAVVAPRMNRFHPDRINTDLGPNAMVDELLWIGPHFKAALLAAGVIYLEDALEILRGHTLRENKEWMRNVFTNERANQCVPAIVRSTALGRAPRGQRIRPTGWFAYNSLLTYARAHLNPIERARLPALLKADSVAASFPNRCAPPIAIAALPAAVPAAIVPPVVPPPVPPPLPARHPPGARVRAIESDEEENERVRPLPAPRPRRRRRRLDWQRRNRRRASALLR